MKHSEQFWGSKVFYAIILFLNAIAVILLLAAYLAYHISPASVSGISFAALAYPYILIVNLVFVVLWGFIRVRYAFISLLVIVAGWNHIGRLVQIKGSNLDDKHPAAIKVLSYNMQNFLKINTSSTKYVTDFSNEEKIREFLAEQKSDVVCLQEMFNDRQPNDLFVQGMSRLLGCKHYYYENYFSSTLDKLDALAIFSRFPIINTGHLTHEKKSIGIYTDLVWKEDTIRVYNLHLASIHFKVEDYKFWSQMSNNADQDSLKSGTFRIIKKINRASVKRALQVKTITSNFDSSPYPIIICGDFNDSPSSYSYRKILGKRQDAFVESGSGFASTYAGEFFPSFRIDFILYDPVFSSAQFTRYKIPLSDHYPISAYLYRK